jgi:tRNA-dihydrouridine synthase
LQPDTIDINMGCSVNKVSQKGAGAGLLRTPHKIAEIFQRLSTALPVPITGKIRLGWDDQSRNYLEVAHILEDNGASAIAVHGRTKAQAYKGEADWAPIAQIKAAVKIPVITAMSVLSRYRRIKTRPPTQMICARRSAIRGSSSARISPK